MAVDIVRRSSILLLFASLAVRPTHETTSIFKVVATRQCTPIRIATTLTSSSSISSIYTFGNVIRKQWCRLQVLRLLFIRPRCHPTICGGAK
jgi:hypothetical protein